jgi:hypothetical protein
MKKTLAIATILFPFVASCDGNRVVLNERLFVLPSMQLAGGGCTWFDLSGGRRASSSTASGGFEVSQRLEGAGVVVTVTDAAGPVTERRFDEAFFRSGASSELVAASPAGELLLRYWGRPSPDGDTGCAPIESAGPEAGDTAAAETSADVDIGVAASLTAVTPARTPKPIAALKLATGNSVEFYEIGGHVLISEEGDAYAPPTINVRQKIDARPLAEIWTSLAPDKPVPAGLLQAQARLDQAAPPATTRPRDLRFAGGAPGETAAGDLGGDDVLAVAVGCNNGCCDWDWMYQTFPACHTTNYDYHWTLFNYAWSYANVSGVHYYDGFVCSASGTSTYKVYIDGDGGTWSVPEAHYRTYTWYDCPFCWENAYTSVNTSTSPHLHTYCGGTWDIW